MRILILCTGNSCRSQMAHGFMQSFDKEIEIRSAGTFPASRVSHRAIKVMAESGIDIRDHTPDNVSQYLSDEWDYVITVCDNARKMCPVFTAKVHRQIHLGFEDPSEFLGSEEQKMKEFRRIRDEIKNAFHNFYKEFIS